jgi:hypothetical protein
MSTKGSRIRGTVTDTSGRPIRAASVRATKDGRLSLISGSSTSGAFTLGPATDGSYRLEVVPSTPWAPLSVDTPFDLNGQDVSDIQLKLKSRAKITAKLTPGKGTAKVAVDITRRASGAKPSGTVTIRWGTISKTVKVVKGKATVKLSGLPKGKRTITVTYAGTSSTAATTATFRTVVK